MTSIDLNSDLGESFGVWRLGDDEALLELVTSANVACGFHAGDPSTMRAVCTAAVANHVSIGAQVGYPDLVGFGRRYLDIDPRDLRDAVLYQLGALDAFAQVAGSEVAYVKPHGALYHATVGDAAQADAVVAAAAEYDPSLAVLGAPGSRLLRAAEAAGLEPIAEAFADRAYLATAVWCHGPSPTPCSSSRRRWRRAVRLATEHEVVAVDGTVVAVEARSLCVQGDTPGAVELARAVRDALDQAGVGVERVHQMSAVWALTLPLRNCHPGTRRTCSLTPWSGGSTASRTSTASRARSAASAG